MTSVSDTDNRKKGNALRSIILFLFILTAFFSILFFLYCGYSGFLAQTPLYYLSGTALLFLIFYLIAPVFRPLTSLLPAQPVRPVLLGMAFAFSGMLILPCTPLASYLSHARKTAAPYSERDFRSLMLIIAAEGCGDTYRIIGEDDVQSFRQYYRYTLEYYEKNRHAGVLGVLLPRGMTEPENAAVLSALKQVFRKVYVIQLPEGSVAYLASDDPRLTDNWDELEKRAQNNGAYAYVKMPENIDLLRVVFPLYQDQEEIGKLQKLSAETKPSSIKNATFQQFPVESVFLWMQVHFILIFLVFAALYAAMRYWQGGPDFKKQRFRLFEFGFFYAGIFMTIFFKFHSSVCSYEGMFSPFRFYGFCFLFFAVAALFPPRKEFLIGNFFILITLFFTLFTMKYAIYWYLFFLVTIAASHMQSRLAYAGQAAPAIPCQIRYIFPGMAASVLFSALAAESGNAGFWIWGSSLMLLPFLRRQK